MTEPDAAVATPQLPPCQRCGTFAELYPVAGRRICQSCLDYVDAIERTPMGVGTVLSGVVHLLKRIGLASALMLVVVDLPIAAIEVWLHPPTVVSNVYGLLVSIVPQGAVLVMAHGAITGETPTGVLSTLRHALGRWPALVGTQFLINLVTVIGAVLCLVPGIIAALGFTVALNLVLFERDSGTSAMRASWNHMKGHKGTVFVAYLVAALPLVGLFVLLSVAIGGAAFATIDSAGPVAFEQTPAFRIAEGAFTVLVPAFLTPILVVPAVVYAKLRTAADTQSLSLTLAGQGLG